METLPLSPREVEVLRSLAWGYSLKEIAAELDVSAKTIETYKMRAMKKLGLSGRVQLVRHAVENGWFVVEQNTAAGNARNGEAEPLLPFRVRPHLRLQCDSEQVNS